MAEKQPTPAVTEENTAPVQETPAEPTAAEPTETLPVHTAYDVEQDTAPVPKKKPKKKIWFARHKVLTVIFLLLIAGGVFVAVQVRKAQAAIGSMNYQFVRTTTLKKTSLDNSVTTTGTVAAGSTASVTVSDSAKLYKVTEVLVKVGDSVKTGDVIANLDTTDVLTSIEKAKQDYSDTLTAAQTSYDRAADDYKTSVVEHENKLIDLQAKIDEADKSADTAQKTADDAQSAADAATSSYNTIKSAYDTAQGQISTFQSEYNGRESDLSAKLSDLNAKIADYNAQIVSCQADPANYIYLCPAAEQMVLAYYSYNGNGVDYAGSSLGSGAAGTTVSSAVANTVSVAAVEASVNQYFPGGNWTVASSYMPGNYATSALCYYETAAKNLSDAQANISNASLGYSSFAEMETALKTAEQTKTAAETTLKQAKTALETATSQQKSARDSYDTEKNSTTLKNKNQSVEDAKTKLTQAKRTPDNLTTLENTLANCTLTATMSGTVTALNATVGSVCSGTVATIQDTQGLTVKITIAADKVSNVKTGMPCYITADTTADTINGTLTQIDPVANDQGTFGAEVSVSSTDSGLLIGTSAQVEIMESQTDNVFVVPMDAVGTAEDGSSFVYRQTGGEGVDMTFEQVTVTVGSSNDYYTEISGDALAEGDVIRSSSDMSEGIESSANTEDANMMMMGGAEVTTTDGGDMGGGPGGDRSGGQGGGQGGAPGGM